jgi:hypothetical protein
MKLLDTFTFSLSVIGALVGYFLLTPPLSFAVIGICALFATWSLFADSHGGPVVLRLGGLSWTDGGFRARLAYHRPHGLGKTQSAIKGITFQIFQNVKNWGGICLDQKGLYWETVSGETKNSYRLASHTSHSQPVVLDEIGPFLQAATPSRLPIPRCRFLACHVIGVSLPPFCSQFVRSYSRARGQSLPPPRTVVSPRSPCRNSRNSWNPGMRSSSMPVRDFITTAATFPARCRLPPSRMTRITPASLRG